MIRFQTEFELPTCSVDPVTLTGLALAAVGGGVASSLAGGSSAPTPTPPPQQAPPQQAPVGVRPQNKTNQPSFVGSSATPSTDTGQKTLLGQ